MDSRKSNITLVVTSCGRYDLLARTLESLYAYNDYPFREVIIAEDWDRIGQVKLIDRAYASVLTPYVFHCEDDWEFYRHGFMEKSLHILEQHPNVLQVWLRAHNDTNYHPVIYNSHLPFPILDPKFNAGTHSVHEWGGFSWNPGLRRISDWQKIGGYTQYLGDSADVERKVSQVYRDMGYVAAISDVIGFVRHIGEGRSLPK